MATLQFDHFDFDAGEQLSIRKIEAKFHFTNIGSTPVRILSVRSSCGCTAAAPSNRVIQPGERGSISATFDPSGRSGSQHKTITVHTDDPAAPEVTLRLLCSVVPAVTTDPPALALLGVEEGSLATLSFRAMPAHGLQIQDVRLQSDLLELVRSTRTPGDLSASTFSAQGAIASPDDTRGEHQSPEGWTIRAKSQKALEGTLGGTLIVTFTDPEVPTHEQPVQFQVVGPFESKPSIVVGQTYAGEDLPTLSAIIQRRDGQAFRMTRWALVSRLDEAEAERNWFEPDEGLDQESTSHTLEVVPNAELLGLNRLDGSSRTRLWSGWIILETISKDERRELRIPSRVFIRPSR